MASTDWSPLTGNPATSLIARNVSMGHASAGIDDPPDRGVASVAFLYGFNSIVGTDLTSALYASDNVAMDINVPTAADKAGSITGCIKRHTSLAGYYPFMGLLDAGQVAPLTMGTPPRGYLLTLSNEEPYRIVLFKGAITADVKWNSSGVLRYSDAQYSTHVWHHLKLDVIYNPQGDLVINVRENIDTSPPDPTAPVWTAIDGIDQYIDDSLGVVSGSLPYGNRFYFVYGHYSEEANRVSIFDYFEVFEQTSP